MGSPRLTGPSGGPPLGLLAFLSAALIAGCGVPAPPLVLAATTSTYDSGLLDSLVSRFRASHPGLRVRTLVAGSGEALELGRRGDADVLLVHAPRAEARFVAEGLATRREPVMSNDFVLVGPPGDPAEVAGMRPAAALARIARRESRFVSRGDSSGTHEREIALWREAGVAPAGAWYIETGQGQAMNLQVASERGGYTLTDRATYTVLRDALALTPLVESPEELINVYSAIIPVASRQPELAAVLVDWLRSAPGREAIASYRLDGAAEPLFRPLAADAPPPAN